MYKNLPVKLLHTPNVNNSYQSNSRPVLVFHFNYLTNIRKKAIVRSNWVAIKTGFRKPDCHKPRTDQQIDTQQSNAPAEASTNYGKFFSIRSRS